MRIVAGMQVLSSACFSLVERKGVNVSALKKEKEQKPLIQKATMLFFSVGPIFLIIWFLFQYGFFDGSNL